MKALIIIIITCSFSYGQTIKGRIISTLDNEPMPGCNISNGDSSLMTTDNFGRFEIILTNQIKTIEFNFIGYTRIQITNLLEDKDYGDIYMFWGPETFHYPKKGTFVEKYGNGNINTSISYKQHRLHDICTKYYENGKKQIEGFYKNRNKVGVWKYFKPDGQVVQATFAENKQVVN